MKPLDLVAMMVLENGQRWGDAATEDQWEDMIALLEPDGGPRWHFWLRSRGRSKTFDTAAATVAFMLAGGAGPGDEMFAAAAGKEQAQLLPGKIQGILRNTPELSGAVEVQQQRVITPRTGAVLNVMSSELATSWGKTPLWVFVDEICNHDNTAEKKAFVNALITALPKRRDSNYLAASNPSFEGHWSYDMWQHAEKSPRWRASAQLGPAPWQDPGELEDMRALLLDYEWERLFLGQWASADDVVADRKALEDCTRTAPAVPPEPGAEYVVTWDIGWRKDHSAVAVAHMGTRAGRKCVIIDRLEAWVPRPGKDVRISEVLDRAAELSAEYNGALLTGDPHEAWQTVQDLKEAGYNVKPADTSPAANSVRAKDLLRLVRDRSLEIPEDGQLQKEFLSLRLAEGTTPGVVRLTSDGSAKGHFDRVTAILYATGEILSRPGQSWREMNGKLCDCIACRKPYLAQRATCPWCGTVNPSAPQPQVRATVSSGEYTPSPGSWASAYLPAGTRRCAFGHFYAPVHGDTCPRCHNGVSSTTMPAAFARALTLGRR